MAGGREGSGSLACVKALSAILPGSHFFDVGSRPPSRMLQSGLPLPPPAPPLTTCLLLPSANTSLLQGFWCQPAGQLSQDQLSALIRRMASQQVLLKAWQVSSLGWRYQAGVPRARAGSREKALELGRKQGRPQQRTQASKVQDYTAVTQTARLQGAVLETLHMVVSKPTCQLHSHLRSTSQADAEVTEACPLRSGVPPRVVLQCSPLCPLSRTS